jgi:hypothetical protein
LASFINLSGQTLPSNHIGSRSLIADSPPASPSSVPSARQNSSFIYPFAEQVRGYQAGDADRGAAGFVLEVKDEFCHNVRKILKTYGRQADYFEISLDCPYRYNPLHNDLEAYALAYSLSSLLNNLFGRGKEFFWQQAHTKLVKFILLHKVAYDYVTLFDSTSASSIPTYWNSESRKLSRSSRHRDTSLFRMPNITRCELMKCGFDRDASTNELKAVISVELLRYLDQNHIPHSSSPNQAPMRRRFTPALARRREQLEAVKRWFYHDWRRIEPTADLRCRRHLGVLVPIR